MQCPFLKYELDRSLPANATRTLRDLAKRSSLPAKLENRRRTSQNQECRRAQTQIFASKAARFASQLCFPRGLPCCSCGLRDIKLFPDPLRPGHRQSGYTSPGFSPLDREPLGSPKFSQRGPPRRLPGIACAVRRVSVTHDGLNNLLARNTH